MAPWAGALGDHADDMPKLLGTQRAGGQARIRTRGTMRWPELCQGPGTDGQGSQDSPSRHGNWKSCQAGSNSFLELFPWPAAWTRGGVNGCDWEAWEGGGGGARR